MTYLLLNIVCWSYFWHSILCSVF